MTMCDREEELLRALRSGDWTPNLRAHFASCENCAELAMAAEFMTHAARTVDSQVAPVGLMWWKAQLRARREDSAAAARPVILAERATAVLALLGAVWAMAWLSAGSLPAAVAVAGIVALGLITLAAAGALLFAWSKK